MYPDILEARRRFYEDIVLLLSWRPLINAGIIVPVTTPMAFCPHCFALQFFGQGPQKNFVRARRALANRIRREVAFALIKEHGELVIEAHGPERLLEHGYASARPLGPPPFLAGHQSLAEHLDQHGRVDIPRRVVGSSRLDDFFAESAFRSVSFEMAVSQVSGAQYLADRELQVDLLAAIAGDDEMTRQNEIVQRFLSAIVPFVSDIAADDLVRLRKDEGDAFELFRKEFARVVAEWAQSGGSLTEKDARQLHLDVIRPRLAGVEQQIRIARQRMKRGVGWDVFTLGAVISFGLYKGFGAPSLLEVAKLLGVAAAAEGVVSAVRSPKLAEREVSVDPMYFLWKVRERGKRGADSQALA